MNQPLPESILGHYKILRRLGAGGMGVVYEAEDLKLGRHVAIKLLAGASDSVALERFWREARTASALNHPAICTIYEINESAGQPFLVMEMLEGDSLDQLCSGGCPTPVLRLVEAGIQVADALDAAHRKGILHRDVKPGNIFITASGQAKILDFGLARFEAPGELTATGVPAAQVLTTPGTTLGTVAYMSPEQARGEPLDNRSDLFSLGVVLYEMATGRHPFAGATSAVVFDKLLNYLPPAPLSLNHDLPRELEDVLGRALEKDRELRYQSAADMRADLRRLQRNLVAPRAMTASPPADPVQEVTRAPSSAASAPAPPSVIHPPTPAPRPAAGSPANNPPKAGSASDIPSRYVPPGAGPPVHRVPGVSQPGLPQRLVTQSGRAQPPSGPSASGGAPRAGSSGRLASASGSASGHHPAPTHEDPTPLMLPTASRRIPEEKSTQSRRDLFIGVLVVLLAVVIILGAGVWSRATHEAEPGQAALHSAGDAGSSQDGSAPPATAASFAGTYPAHHMRLNGQTCDGSLQLTPARLVYSCGVQSVTLARADVSAIDNNTVVDSSGKKWPVQLDGMTAAQVHELLDHWFTKAPPAASRIAQH